MTMHPWRRPVLAAITIALTLALTGCPDDKTDSALTPEQKAEAERQQREAVVTGVSISIDVASQGLGAGIRKVQENRRSGKSTRSKAESLKLAQRAKKLNDVMRRVAGYLLARSELTEGDRRTIAADVDDMISLAQEISRVTVSTDSGKQLAFELGVLAARTTLSASAGKFLRMPGLDLPITPEAKAALQDALHFMDANDDLLEESFGELSVKTGRKSDAL